VFASNCATCHGPGGAGLDPLIGPVLIGNGLGPGAILNQVQNGSAGMPPFGPVLTAEELQAVVQYVNGL
jgi:alcohol dehydrogenase (cytochrome c)/quinohemoprotein ethanol dehydrogenase